MADGTSPLTRCGIDTVEIARVERLLLTASPWRRRMARGRMREGTIVEGMK